MGFLHDRSFDHLDCGVALSGTVRDHSQQVPGSRVMRVCLQDLLAELGSFGQTPPAIFGSSLREKIVFQT
ncbi:MAG TPA: hypothetical protein VLY24_01175 [Bryobacteraceae bacterium]|nr:hypothetical protein [Bryobacteraceae bacterium]